jgi:hypothetical protein
MATHGSGLDEDEKKPRAPSLLLAAFALFIAGLVMVFSLWWALNGFGSAWSTPFDALRFIVLPTTIGITSLAIIFVTLWLLDNPKG